MTGTGPKPAYGGAEAGKPAAGKLGGGCEYIGVATGGGALGAFCPGKVARGGCNSDCCAAVAPFSR